MDSLGLLVSMLFIFAILVEFLSIKAAKKGVNMFEQEIVFSFAVETAAPTT